MKIAVAYWNDRIAPVFDTARRILVIDTEAGRIVRESDRPLPTGGAVQKALALVELGVDMLICGAISRPLGGLVSAYGIRVIPFVAGDLREVLREWFDGNRMLDGFAMPGCRGRNRRRARGKQKNYRRRRP